MSQIKEQPGTLFFPVRIVEGKLNKNTDICISIFHHHPAWMTPNTIENNRTEFIDFVNEHSDFVLVGHEHQQRSELNGLIGTETVKYFCGEALGEVNKQTSGFQSFIIDIDSRNGVFNHIHGITMMICMKNEKNLILNLKNFILVCKSFMFVQNS